MAFPLARRKAESVPAGHDGASDRLLTRLLVWSSAVIAFGTPIVQWAAPANSLNFSDDLADGPVIKTVGLNEPADSFLFALWVFLALGMLTVGITSARGRHHVASPLRRWEVIVGASSLVVLAAQMFLPLASGEQVNRGPTSLWVGAGVVLVVFGGVGNAVLARPIWRWGLGVAVGTALVLTLVQTPSSVVDPYHFSFVANEMLAVSAGEFPLGGVVHQYTNLLPYAVAPILEVLPVAPLAGLLGLTLLLQLFVLGALGWIIRQTVSSGGVRAVSYLLLAGCGLASYSYVQTFPIRFVVPLAVLVLIGRTCHSGGPVRPSSSVVGAMLGATSVLLIVNNADFGGAAALALVATEVVIGRQSEADLRSWAFRIGGFALGALVALFTTGLLITALAGEFVIGDLVTFARAFGGSGFYREPMALLEPAVVLVLLGLTGLAIGIRQEQSDCSTREYSTRVYKDYWLVVMSLFLLLLFAYPMGRSFQTTFVALSLPGVIVGANVLDRALTAQTSANDWLLRVFSSFVGLMSLMFIGGQISSSVSATGGIHLWWDRSHSLSVIEEDALDRGFSLELGGGAESIRLPAGVGLPDAQALGWSNLYEVQFGLESVAVSNHIESVLLLRDLVDRQCLALSETSDPVLLLTTSVERLAVASRCEETFASRGIVMVEGTELSVLGGFPDG